MLIFCASELEKEGERGQEGVREECLYHQGKASPSLDGVRPLISGGDYIVRIFNEDKSKKGNGGGG